MTGSKGLAAMPLTCPVFAVARAALGLLAGLALAGCNTLPASGPTAADILNGVSAKQNTLGFRIVNLDAGAIRAITTASATAQPPPGAGSSPALGRIGVGDVLTISIFEVGNSLFTPSGAAAAAEQSQAGAGASGAAGMTNLPLEQVATDGTIDIPYAAHLVAAGKTPAQLARDIQAALAGQSQNPQVIVNITTNNANTLVISGDVKTQGRIPLTLLPERVSDMIALAGGASHPDADEIVQITSAGQTIAERLSDMYDDPALNPYVRPGDRIHLVYQPRSYTVFGAAGLVQQVDFNDPNITLAEAVARAGGPKDDQADPTAVFVFRFEQPAIARELGLAVTGKKVPVIYQLDMMQPTSYFVEQEFAMRDQDVLYIGNARTNQLQKFFTLIGTLFAPAATASSINP
jgi:polysaccharide export outer membrane protein